MEDIPIIEAEVLAIRKGLIRAIRDRYCKAIIENDSLVTVRAIMGELNILKILLS